MGNSCTQFWCPGIAVRLRRAHGRKHGVQSLGHAFQLIPKIMNKPDYLCNVDVD